MHSRLLWRDADLRGFVVILDEGDEVVAALGDFARLEGIAGASLTALGAFSKATVGWFDFAKRDYRPIAVDEQCEALSLLGDIARDDADAPSLHIHAVLGLADGTTRGGHLLKAFVRPTLEVMVTETPAHLHRRRRPELGIALIDLG